MVKYDFNRKQTTILCVVLFCLILLSIPLTSFLGSANLSARQVFEVYGSKIDPTRYASIQKNIHNIVWELRLPRAILSICVGGGLALCGEVMQALTKIGRAHV